MNNLMMNLIPGNEFAIGLYSIRRAVYLGNIRPVGVRLRPDGAIGWGERGLTFDPKVFAFAVQTRKDSWERRVFTLNSVKERLKDTWENYSRIQNEEENKRKRSKKLTKDVETFAKEIFGEECVSFKYGFEVVLDNLLPENLAIVCRIKNLEKVSRHNSLLSLCFTTEEEGIKLVERMKRELDNKRQFSGPAVKQITC